MICSRNIILILPSQQKFIPTLIRKIKKNHQNLEYKLTTNSHADPSNFEPVHVHPYPPTPGQLSCPYKYYNPIAIFSQGSSSINLCELFFPKILLVFSTFISSSKSLSKIKTNGRIAVQEHFFKEIIIKEQWFHKKMCFFSEGTKGQSLHPPPLRHHASMLVHSRR